MTTPHDLGEHIAALLAIDKSTVPPDGGDRFNRLIFARSPYLLQHAENPVDWYEWGDEAFARARDENLPVLLSIGYATCHWCHVMAHESFEDQEVATVLNRYFVCIKVDREERPDIDDFYMTVSHLLTGSGGWPLNIFLTPDKRPFMAISYLPKQSRGQGSGFLNLLANIATLWRQGSDLIEKNCASVMEAMGNISQPAAQQSADLEELNRQAFEQLQRMYDWEMGGFGPAPKFPMPIYLSWLIAQAQHGNTLAAKLALPTLQSIRFGGIWDHVGGGLHRYSTDREWLVPHFEKMLYDQALVALAALEAYQLGGDELFLGMASDIFLFVERELGTPEGAFCAALDADTEGVEGKYYLWDKREIEECLGDDAELFCRFYGVTDEGNFEGHTILNIPAWLDEFCAREDLDEEETARTLQQCLDKLLTRRERRVHPFRDSKIVTSWNGLMIAALARGGSVSGKREYCELAARSASFILTSLRRADGRLLRCFLTGASAVPAFLEDYANLCFGLLELFEATLETTWLDEALRLADEALGLFLDPVTGYFGTIGRDAEQMPAQFSLDHDGATPSAVSMMTQVLARLSHACDRPDLADFAHQALSGRLAVAIQQPLAHLGALQALALLETEPVIVTFGNGLGADESQDLLRIVRRHTLQNCVIKREAAPGATPGVLVCGGGMCHPPVREGVALAALLDRLFATVV